MFLVCERFAMVFADFAMVFVDFSAIWRHMSVYGWTYLAALILFYTFSDHIYAFQAWLNLRHANRASRRAPLDRELGRIRAKQQEALDRDMSQSIKR